MNFTNLTLLLIIILVFYHKNVVALLKNRINDLEDHIAELENRNTQLVQKNSDRELEIQNLYYLLLEQKINKTIDIGSNTKKISLPSGYYFLLAILNAMKGYYQYKKSKNV